jgi:hypothetical protein
MLEKNSSFRNNIVSEKQIGLKPNGVWVFSQSIWQTACHFISKARSHFPAQPPIARSKYMGTPGTRLHQGPDVSDSALNLQKVHENHYFSCKCVQLLTNEFWVLLAS